MATVVPLNDCQSSVIICFPVALVTVKVTLQHFLGRSLRLRVLRTLRLRPHCNEVVEFEWFNYDLSKLNNKHCARIEKGFYSLEHFDVIYFSVYHAKKEKRKRERKAKTTIVLITRPTLFQISCFCTSFAPSLKKASMPIILVFVSRF